MDNMVSGRGTRTKDIIVRRMAADRSSRTLNGFAKPVYEATKEGPEGPSQACTNETFAALPGIDWESALERCGGDEALLNSLFLEFAQSFRNIPAGISAARERGDFAEALRLVHSTKGVAGTLGAIEVHRAAEDLEHAVKRHDEEDYQLLIDHFGRMLCVLLDAIDRLCTISRFRSARDAGICDESTSSMDLSGALDKLSRLLKCHDTESFHVVRFLEKELSSEACRPLEDLKTCLDRFDFQAARHELDKLARMLDVAGDRETE